MVVAWCNLFLCRVASNRRQGLHTLCLLDIKVKEPNLESLARGRPVYEPPRCAVTHGFAVPERHRGHGGHLCAHMWLVGCPGMAWHTMCSGTALDMCFLWYQGVSDVGCWCSDHVPSLATSVRYMTVNTAVQQLLEVEQARGEGAFGPDTLAVGMSRLGSPDQQIVAGSMHQLLDVDFGPPLHCLVIAGATEQGVAGGLSCMGVLGWWLRSGSRWHAARFKCHHGICTWVQQHQKALLAAGLVCSYSACRR